MDEQSLLRRLVEVRLLLKLASEVQDRPEPANSYALLIYHDAIELLLCVAASKHRFTLPQKLDEYWNLLAKEGIDLSPWQAPIQRLGRARAAYKHQGIAPSSRDLAEFRHTARDFVEKEMGTLTGIPFSRVRLSMLVPQLRARRRFHAAMVAADSQNWQKAGKYFSLAFGELLVAFEAKQTAAARSPYFFGEDMTAMDARSLSLDPALDPLGNPDIKEPLAPFINATQETLRRMQRALRIIAMGINYPQYVRFKRLTPKVRENSSRRLEVRPNMPPNFQYMPKELEFLQRFIIDSALRLQRENYEAENLVHRMQFACPEQEEA